MPAEAQPTSQPAESERAPGASREVLGGRWLRRAVTIPATLAALALALALLPVAAPLALLWDLGRPGRTLTRFLALVLYYLGCEAAGLVASAALTLSGPAGSPRWLKRHYRLQWWWAGSLFWAAVRLFELQVQVEGEEALRPGPVLLLSRHVSTGDTVLPAALVSAPHHLRLRYVLKRELQVDPCLDVVGHRIPNAFVYRGDRPGADLEAVAALGRALGPEDGVLLYPEGTRFSPGRRERLLADPATAPALRAQAERLRCVLPARQGGVLTLLTEAPQADVVFCGHVGFEGVRRLSDFWNGALRGRTLRVGFWRCPRATIPEGREAREAWLAQEWERMDAWVAAKQEAA